MEISGSFTIPKQSYEGLSDLIDMGQEKLDHVADEVAVKELTLNVEMLSSDLAKAVEFDRERLKRAIFTVLIPLSGIRSDFRTESHKFVALFIREIKRQNSKWHEENHAKFAEILPALASLIEPDGYFGLLHKMFELISNRPCVALNFKILTELRPVYNEEATTAKAMLLTNTMIIRYNDSGDAKTIHLTVDRDDLKAIQEQLDRTEKKILAMEEQAGQLGVPVLVVGAE